MGILPARGTRRARRDRSPGSLARSARRFRSPGPLARGRVASRPQASATTSRISNGTTMAAMGPQFQRTWAAAGAGSGAPESASAADADSAAAAERSTRARSSSCRAMNSAADPARAAWAASGSRAYPACGFSPPAGGAPRPQLVPGPGASRGLHRPAVHDVLPGRGVPARLVPGRAAIVHPDVVDQIHLGHRGPRHLVHPERIDHGDARGAGHDAGAQRARVHDPGDRDDHERRDQRRVVMVTQRQHDQQHDRERGPRPPRHQGLRWSGRPAAHRADPSA